MFEIIPTSGGKYSYDLFSKDEYPLQEGESYTMLIYQLADESCEYYNKKLYYYDYVKPLNGNKSYEQLSEKYGFKIQPYGMICEEIAALFKDSE